MKEKNTASTPMTGWVCYEFRYIIRLISFSFSHNYSQSRLHQTPYSLISPHYGQLQIYIQELKKWTNEGHCDKNVVEVTGESSKFIGTSVVRQTPYLDGSADLYSPIEWCLLQQHILGPPVDIYKLRWSWSVAADGWRHSHLQTVN